MECYFNKRRLITNRCGRHVVERTDVAAWNKDGDYCLYRPGSSLPGKWSSVCSCSHAMKDVEAGYDHEWLRGEIFKRHPYGHWCPNRRSFVTHRTDADCVNDQNYLANHLVHVSFKPYDHTYYELESDPPSYGLRPVNYTWGYENGMQQNVFHCPMVDRISEWKNDLPVGAVKVTYFLNGSLNCIRKQKMQRCVGSSKLHILLQSAMMRSVARIWKPLGKTYLERKWNWYYEVLFDLEDPIPRNIVISRNDYAFMFCVIVSGCPLEVKMIIQLVMSRFFGF